MRGGRYRPTKIVLIRRTALMSKVVIYHRVAFGQ